jgi:exocyst complex component 4
MTGLSILLDDLLLHFAPKIPVMNPNGCGRLQLNILVLQQNLKNVEPAALLSRSATYYDLCFEGPEAIVSAAREKGKELGFTYEEMKTLLELSYSEGVQSERREVAVQAKRSLDENVLALSEYLW